MAPSFLQKLVKAANPSPTNSAHNPRERVSSDAYPAARSSETNSAASPTFSVSSSGSGRNRAHSASASYSSLTSPTTPTQASTTGSKRSSGSTTAGEGRESRIPSIITTLSGGGRSLGRKKSKNLKKDKEKDKKSVSGGSASVSRSNSVSSKHREPVPGDKKALEPPVLGERAGDRRSWASTDTTSTQPNVTVVPPTPVIGNTNGLESDSEDDEEYDSHSGSENESTNAQGRQRVQQPNNVKNNGNKSNEDTAEDPEDVVTPTLPKNQYPNINSHPGAPSSSATSSSNQTTGGQSQSQVKATDYAAPTRTDTSSTVNTTSTTSTTSTGNTSTSTRPSTSGKGAESDSTEGSMSLAPGSYSIRKSSSNKSINGQRKAPPPEINVGAAVAALSNGNTNSNSNNYSNPMNNGHHPHAYPHPHSRAATAPPDASSSSVTVGQGGENGDSVTMTPIVESPTDVKFPGQGSQPQPIPGSQHQANGTSSSITGASVLSTSPSSSSSHTNTTSTTTQPSLSRENTSTSILSPGSNPSSSKRPWRRSSTKKPTGLASAIAASGLAMANPSLSAVHNAQIAPPPIVSPGSSTSTKDEKDKDKQPYLSRSPSESKTSQKSSANLNGGHAKARSADLSPRSSKSRKSSIGSPKQGATAHRSRRTSSARSEASNASEYPNAARSRSQSNVSALNLDADGIRPDYYSGLGGDSEGDSGSESEDDDESVSDLEDEIEDIPVTGFAVASNKRNADFHELFPNVPEGDYLIEDYGCALQREILIQGRLYISENHICFHANIFGWITDLSIPIYEITSLEKKNTAFVIPNAIQITTRQAKYTFASFLSRDTTFDVIFNIWRLARPEDGASMMSSGSGRPSLEGANGGASQGGPAPGTGGASSAALPANAGGGATGGAPQKKATQCQCGKDGKHYTETAMETTFPGTPEKIHTLMFASGFIKDFMTTNQKLLDIQMSDWQPVNPGSKLLTRNFSYIKPLNGSLGPKQTKCELKDEVVHHDPDEFITTVTTTRTPDVPSGGVFAVKTRTCIMWAGPISSKVLVTTQVEWSGRSFIKGIIERSAIDGQKAYHGELERCMRDYIAQHKSEFLPEGVDTAVLEQPAEAAPETPPPADQAKSMDEKQPSQEEQAKRRERERNARGLQWAWDTFDGAWQVAQRSTKGALELVRDAWDQSSSTTILWFVIVILVISNLWTLARMGKQTAKTARKIELRQAEEREKWVQSIVTVLWDELSSGKRDPALGFPGQVVLPPLDSSQAPEAVNLPVPQKALTSSSLPLRAAKPTPSLPPPDDPPVSKGVEQWKQEVQELLQTLDMVELRVKAIRESLTKLDVNALD